MGAAFNTRRRGVGHGAGRTLRSARGAQGCWRFRGVAVLLGFAAAWLQVWPTAHAADRLKANNTTNLNLAGSWSGGVPDLGNTAVWSSTVTGANTSLLGGNVTWQGIKIVTPGGLVTIGPGNTLTLSAGAAGTSIDMTTATQDLTIQSGLALKTAVGQVWNIAGGRTLTLNTGLFTRGAGATLNVQGAGTVIASNIANDPATEIVGPWATFGTGTAARFAAVGAGSILAGYTGGVAAATAADITGTTGLINYDLAAAGTAGAGASFHTLRYSGAAGILAGDFAANGILNSGTGLLTISGNVAAGAGGELVFTNGDGNAARDLAVSGVIRDGVNGFTTVTKAGLGNLTLSGANSYSGITYLTRGKVTLTGAGTLGSTDAGTRIGLSGRLSLAGGVTSAESIFLDDLTNAFSGANLVENLGTNTLSGAIRLSANVRWQSGGTALNVTGGISTTNGASGSSMVMQAATVMNITGKPIANGSGNLYMDNPRTIALGVAGNSYGSHSLYSGTLQTNVANALSREAAVNFSVQYAAASSALDLNGFDQTVGAVATSNFAVHGGYDRVITSAAPATLTTGFANTSTTFDGRFTGAVSVNKIGSGTLTLSGPSTTTGGVGAVAGTLNLNFGRATAAQTGAGAVSNYLPAGAPLTLGGGTLQLTGRNNGTATSLTGAGWAIGQPVVTVASTAGLAPGQPVSHANLPAGSYVVSVLNSTQFVINAAPTVAGSGATITATPNSFTTSQSFSGLTLEAGASGVTVSIPSSGSDGTVLNLGSITQNPGGTVNFTLPSGTQSAANGITTSALNNAAGILGGWARVGNDWAANGSNAAGGNIVALSSYTDVNRLGGALATAVNANVRIVESGSGGSLVPAAAGTTDIHTLLQSAGGEAATYDPGSLDVLRLGAAGGILLASKAGALAIGAAANDGVLTAGGAADMAGTLYLTNNHASNPLTIQSVIADNGAGVVGLTTSGPGTVVLAGTNTHTGRTIVGGGILRVSAEENLGGNPLGFVAGQLTLAGGTLNTSASFSLDDANRGITLAPAGGTISPNAGTTLTVANAITGPGNLTHAGAGTLELVAANTHTGLTFANTGTLALGHVRALQSSTLVTATAGTVTFAVPGANTYHLGGFAGNDAVGLGANTLSVGANDETTTFSGSLSGTGGLIKVGNGILNLNAANTHSGTTRIEGGMLVLAHANALQNSTLDTGATGAQSANLTLPEGSVYNIGGLMGSANLDLALSHLSVGANNQDTVFSGVLQGPFNNNLTKVGSGTLTLLGNNTHTGTTTVSAGRLVIGGTNVSSISVAAGANLGGEGSTRGNLVFLGASHALEIDAGTLAALGATGPGRLDLSALAAGGFTVNVAGTPSGAEPVKVLTYGAGGFSGGIDRFALGTHTASARGAGGFADNGTGAITLDLGYVSNTWVGNAADPTFWDVGSTANWSNPKDSVFQNGDDVVFADGASNLAPVLQVSLNVGSVDFRNTAGTDYTLGAAAGATLTIGTALHVTGSGNVAISSPIAGAGSLALAGTGTTTLSGANTFTGGTLVTQGTLRLSDEASLGTGSLSLDGTGATVTAAGSFAIDDANRAIILGANGGSFGAEAGATLTLANPVTGSGGLGKSGPGTVRLAAANAYTGLTTVSAGTLELGSPAGNAIAGDGAAGTTDIQVAAGATLKLAAADQIADDAAIALAGGNWDLSGQGETIRSLTGIAASNNLPILTLGGSNLTLNRIDWDNTGPVSNSSFTGGGTLRFVADGGTQPVFETNFQGMLTLNPGVRIDAESLKFRAGTYGTVLNGKVSGTGKLVFDPAGGAGGLTVSNSGNDYSGGTQWVSDSGPSGAWDLFTVSASGALGSGEVTLQGGNSQSWTSVFSGTPSAFTFAGNTTHGNDFRLTGDATISAGSPVGDTGTSERVTLSGGVDLGASTLSLRGRGTGTLSGAVTGSGGIAKIDHPGTWILSGVNTYAGSTTVSAGTLLVNGDNSAATGAVTVAAGATLGGSGVLGGDAAVSGTLSTGNPAVNSGLGTLAFSDPGAGVADVALLGGATWLVDIVQGATGTGAIDTLAVEGTLTLDPAALLAWGSVTGDYQQGTVYTMATYAALSGQFAAYQDGSVFELAAGSGLFYQINYGTGAITLTAIPEPESLIPAALLLVAAACLPRRRRCRR